MKTLLTSAVVALGLLASMGAASAGVADQYAPIFQDALNDNF